MYVKVAGKDMPIFKFVGTKIVAKLQQYVASVNALQVRAAEASPIPSAPVVGEVEMPAMDSDRKSYTQGILGEGKPLDRRRQQSHTFITDVYTSCTQLQRIEVCLNV